MCGEIDAILKHPAQKVVLGGQKQLREAMAIILAEVCEKETVLLSDEAVALSTVRGAIAIYEEGDN